MQSISKSVIIEHLSFLTEKAELAADVNGMEKDGHY